MVLLVLDDIEAGQIKQLLDISALAAGSLVIMTSRERNALKEADCDPIMEMDTLSPSASAELFMYYAESQHRVPVNVGSALIAEAIGLCGGLPLSLKV